MKYAVLSPRNAPPAAAATMAIRFRSPVDATTPAVITDVSLGTTGTSASKYAKRKTIRYAHPEAFETRSVNWPNIAAYLREPGRLTPSRVPTQVRALFGPSAGMGITLFRRGEPSDTHAELDADDLRRLLDIERGQRLLLENAYEDAVVALARALESKDSGTGAHSQRVQRYALELAAAVAPELLGDASAEHGFLLHDVGKIGIPDNVLGKRGPLDPVERALMETHTLMGERMLSDVALLRGEGLKVVRSHHERWDGWGYPDRLAGDEIPIGARVFAVADTLDALTNDRPYRAAGSWDDACKVIASEAGAQFDPMVVDAFLERELAMRSLQRQFAGLATLN